MKGFAFYLGLLLLYISAFLLLNDKVFAIHLNEKYLKIEVIDIHYIDNDEYTVVTSLSNISNRTIHIRKFKVSFYTQTEIIGKWEELHSHFQNNPFSEGSLSLHPNETQKVNIILRIPLDIPHLYTNFEGEVNIKLRSKTKLRINSGEKLLYIGESHYWITPKTNKWILREGM